MLIGVVLVLARPSVVRKAHPELGESKAVKAETYLNNNNGGVVMEKVFEEIVYIMNNDYAGCKDKEGCDNPEYFLQKIRKLRDEKPYFPKKCLRRLSRIICWISMIDILFL